MGITRNFKEEIHELLKLGKPVYGTFKVRTAHVQSRMVSFETEPPAILGYDATYYIHCYQYSLRKGKVNQPA